MQPNSCSLSSVLAFSSVSGVILSRFCDEMIDVSPFPFQWHPECKQLVCTAVRRVAALLLLHLYPVLLILDQSFNTEYFGGDDCFVVTSPPIFLGNNTFECPTWSFSMGRKFFCSYHSQSNSVESSLIYEGIFTWELQNTVE